jgi:exopolysaccharide biosynthesis polyprenyl glycosylphosphotransferase
MIPRRFFWLFDLAILIATFWVAYGLTPSVAPFFAPDAPLRTPWIEELFAPYASAAAFPPLRDFAWVLLVMMPSTILFLGLFGNHTSLLVQSRTRIVVGSVTASLVSSGLVTLILFALRSPEWSRLFIFSFTLLSGLVLAAYRLTLRRYFKFRQAAGYYAKNVLLIGLASSIEWMVAYFAKNVPETDSRLIGYLCVSSNQPLPNLVLSSKTLSEANGDRRESKDHPLTHSPTPCPELEDPERSRRGSRRNPLTQLGDAQELGDLVIHRPIDEVIAVHPTSGGEWIKKVIQDCDYFGVLLRVVPEALLFGERKSLQTLYPFEPLHLPAVVMAPPHRDSDALFFKRLFDFAVSAALLVVLSPLFALVALAIKLTTPQLPVFYPWNVVGHNGRRFTGYKFTTMVEDADDRKAELMTANEMTGPVFKIKNDPRVTRLGRFLRKYSINELPQLWSVLRGDMSLVGPRPAGPQELERYEFWHKRKLSIRPGITCLWQVRGRNRISNFDDWVRLDLEYIDNWSLWLDMRILWRTLWVVVAGTGS